MEFSSNASLMNSSIVGTSLYFAIVSCNSWICIFFAEIFASWLILSTSILYCNWTIWSMGFLFTFFFSISNCCSSSAILYSISRNKIDTSVALSMVAVAYVPENCDNLVKFLVGFEGISFKTISIGSFPGGILGVSTLLLFLCLC